MRRFLLVAMACTTTVLLHAQKTLLAGWTFDATAAAPSTPTTVAANLGVYSASANLYADGTNGSSAWLSASELSAFGGSTVTDPRSTKSAGQAYSLLGGTNTIANGKSLVFKCPTTNYHKIKVSLEVRGTGTGFSTHEWSYSTDGTTFTTINNSNTGNNTSSFQTKTVDLTPVTAVENQSFIYLKVTVSGASGATGNNRLDNVQITSDDATWFGSSSTSYIDNANWIAPGLSATHSITPGSSPLNAVIRVGTFQPILGTSGYSINNFTILPNATFAISGNTIFSVNGNLTLKSDVTGTAGIGVCSGQARFAGTGNVVVETYIPRGKRAFRFFGRPDLGTINLSEFTDDIDITGNGADAATPPFTPTATNAASAFTYNTATSDPSQPNDPGWTPATSANNAFTSPVRVLVRGSKGQTGSLNGGTYVPDSVTVDFTFPIGTGITFSGYTSVQPVTYVAGNESYNLLSNPWMCAINMNNATLVGNVNNNYWVWNPNIGTKGGYVSNSFDNDYAMPMNGAFFVKATAAGSNAVQFTEAAKVPPSQSAALFRKNNQANTQKLALSIYSNDILWDNFKLVFSDKSSAALDINDDATKMLNPELNFYSLSADNKALSIDLRPNAEQAIPMMLTSTQKQRFTLKVDDYRLPQDIELYLHDKWLNEFVLIANGISYSFEITDDVKSQGNRFELVQKKKVQPAVAELTGLKLYPNPASESVTIVFPDNERARAVINITDMSGRLVKTILPTASQNGKQSFTVKGWAKGTYYVTVLNASQTTMALQIK